ncbi:MAG: phosphoserine phosphatase SerB [Rhizobiales bacterium 65-9]|nr:phosphoserine phosphatase SerB [Hyphomicrobiales bacterium]OJY38630.1 MAG: phosphoserine phosphatase SerB [Rhizobiales bacterium 65-9]
MSFVATLIANPAAPVLDGALLARAADALPHAAAAAWLDPGVAADIPFTRPDADLKTVSDRLRDAIAGAPVDVVVQPSAHRRKTLFLADMDSTMIGQECIDELADFVGLRKEVSEITERAMRGEIAFEPALRERVALLKGLPLSVIDEIIEKRISFTPGGGALVRTIRANGGYCCLVSGGFTLFTAKIGGAIGFDEHRANILEIEDERLAGKVREPILGREAKLATLLELRTRLALKPEQTMAVGDGANDLAMLGEAGLGVAFHAKPAVAAAAHARIDHADLSALLYAQGYRRDDFASA